MTYPQDASEFLDIAEILGGPLVAGGRRLLESPMRTEILGGPLVAGGRRLLEPSMGTEILGKRGAPYENIRDQQKYFEDLIRQMTEEDRRSGESDFPYPELSPPAAEPGRQAPYPDGIPPWAMPPGETTWPQPAGPLPPPTQFNRPG